MARGDGRPGVTDEGQGGRVAITVEKNQIHRLKADELNLPDRLIDEIERCKSPS